MRVAKLTTKTLAIKTKINCKPQVTANPLLLQMGLIHVFFNVGSCENTHT